MHGNMNVKLNWGCSVKGTQSQTDTRTKYEGWNFNSGNYFFTTDTK